MNNQPAQEAQEAQPAQPAQQAEQQQEEQQQPPIISNWGEKPSLSRWKPNQQTHLKNIHAAAHAWREARCVKAYCDPGNCVREHYLIPTESDDTFLTAHIPDSFWLEFSDAYAGSAGLKNTTGLVCNRSNDPDVYAQLYYLDTLEGVDVYGEMDCEEIEEYTKQNDMVDMGENQLKYSKHFAIAWNAFAQSRVNSRTTVTRDSMFGSGKCQMISHLLGRDRYRLPGEPRS